MGNKKKFVLCFCQQTVAVYTKKQQQQNIGTKVQI